MASATKAARARAEVRFRWLRDIATYLCEFVAFPPPKFPDLGLPENPLVLGGLEIEEAAERLRRYWQMGDGPIGNAILLLENQGAIVARDNLGADTLDGMSALVAEEQRPYMIIGTDKGSPVRWRFDAAHELAHVVLHSRLDPQLLLRPEHFKKIEQQAHRFAAAFLLPLASFGDDLFAPNLDALRAIKPKWKVSIAMMIIRARDAGLLSEDAERRLWVNYSRRGWRRNEPDDDAMEFEEPKLLRRAVELVLADGAQTPADMVASLALSANDVEVLTSVPRGFLDQDFSPVALRSPRSSAADSGSGLPADVIPLPLRPRAR